MSAEGSEARISDYRKQADDARRKAELVTNAYARAMLIQIARQFDGLAALEKRTMDQTSSQADDKAVTKPPET